MNLSQIGDKHGTAKNTHVSFGKTLLDIYEKYFELIRYLPLDIMEIGILNGASLYTWKEYFTNANLFGIDINPPRIKDDRITVFKGDQGNVIDLVNIYDKMKLKEIGATLDIVIDDGSHINQYTLDTFDFFWDKLGHGGLYIIEDLICTYDKASMEWPGMQYNTQGVDLNNKREDFDKFLLNHLRAMDFDQSEIYFMHFYRNVVIMKKA
jgi:hypothetical protein